MNKVFNALIFICLICFVSCEGLFPPVKAPQISATQQTDGSYTVTMDAGRNGSIFYTLDGSEPKYPESTLENYYELVLDRVLTLKKRM